MASVINAIEAREAYMARMKAELRGPRYDWLLRKLSRSDDSEYPLQCPLEYSCLCVLDFGGNAGPKEVLRAPASRELPGGLFRNLQSELSLAVTRVVLLSYPWIDNLNLTYIGAIGYTLDLNPQSFVTHFQDSSRGRLKENRRPPSRLHLDTTILQFRFRKGRRLTACTVQNTGKSPIIFGGILLLCKLKMSSCNFLRIQRILQAHRGAYSTIVDEFVMPAE